MLSIQELGTQILSGKPQKLYIMLGDEWGIKAKYIDHLKSHYNGQYFEYPSVPEFISFTKTKRLIPIPPAVYVIRQDETFLSNLSECATSLLRARIPGTLVCVYDGDKYLSKFDKVLSSYTSIVTAVSKPHLTKYLHTDFPKLPSSLINIATHISGDYGEAKNICEAMSCVPSSELVKVPAEELSKIFGYSQSYTELQVKMGIAARDFEYLLNAMQTLLDDLDSVLYSILSTMIELEKLKCNSRAQSDLSKYAKHWKIEEIYYMFVYTYEEIRKLRSMSSYDAENSILFLISLLKFSPIPAPEELLP